MFDSKEHTNRLRAALLTKSSQNGPVPVWYMRQAGRYLPEYQRVMEKRTNFLEACYETELVVEVTLQPIKRFDVDAAIIFSDIMIIPDIIGYEVRFFRGEGPKITKDYKKTLSIEESLERANPIFESIKQVRSLLPKTKALIGFAGAPWTVAAYILGKEKKTADLIGLYRSERETVITLIEELTSFTATYLKKQISSGADVIQLFDSNASVLPYDLFYDLVIKPTAAIVSELNLAYPNVPIIGFPKGAGVLYSDYATKTGVNATSVDYSIPPLWIRNNIPGAVQGNLDPTVLAYNITGALDSTREIISALKHKPLIFNLGHGMLPSTPPDNVKRLTDFVRELTA